MRMSERHHVDMAVMFKPCGFNPARVPSSKICICQGFENVSGDVKAQFPQWASH